MLLSYADDAVHDYSAGLAESAQETFRKTVRDWFWPGGRGQVEPTVLTHDGSQGGEG